MYTCAWSLIVVHGHCGKCAKYIYTLRLFLLNLSKNGTLALIFNVAL